MSDTQSTHLCSETFFGTIKNIDTIGHVITISPKGKVFDLWKRFDISLAWERPRYFELLKYVAMGELGVEVTVISHKDGAEWISASGMKGTEKDVWRSVLAAST